MTVIAFLLGLVARGNRMDIHDPLAWLLLAVGVALIFIEVGMWVRSGE